MARKPRSRPVHKETITVKRYCDTGKFAPGTARDNNCGAPRQAGPRQDEFKPRPTDRDDKVCYTTRGEAMRAFVERNRPLIEAAGGLNAKMSGGELDSVNETYSLKGRKRVTTFRDAIRVAMDGHKCLTDLDIATLNETAVCGGRCELPDAVHEEKARRAYEDYHGGGSAPDPEPGDDDVPF